VKETEYIICNRASQLWELTSYSITQCYQPNSVTCQLAEVTSRRYLSQLQLVLDLLTLEGCKAELI